jgi:signal transduction histidine kinase
VSLRLRLLLTSLLTLALGLGTLLIVGNVLLGRRVDGEASSVLRAYADAQVAGLRVTSGGVRVVEAPNDAALDNRAWVFSGDRVLERPAGVAAAVDRVAVALGRAARLAERDFPGAKLRLRAVPVRAAPGVRPAGAVVVAFSTASLEHLQAEVLVGSLVVAALVLLAGGIAIRSALDGALHPVAQMTASAEDWGAHDLDRRFDLGPPRDELTALAGTLDRLLGRIAASRRHEQRFAAEVAHELRTPLATLRLRAELAGRPGNADADAEEQTALAQIIEDATRMTTAIDALVTAARYDADPQFGAVDLGRLAAAHGETVGVDPAALPPAEGDADVVERALAPLLENAHRHARTRVWLELGSDATHVQVAVRDDGPGLDPALGERAFEPGARGADEPPGGAGLGLPLARRLARSCGGDVTARPGPGGCFVLRLPALGQAVRF